MHRYFRFSRGIMVVAAGLLLAAMLHGCGGCSSESDGNGNGTGNGGGANGGNDAGGNGTTQADDLAVIAAKPAGLDAVDRKIMEIERLENNAQFSQARRLTRELLDEIADDPREADVEAIQQRIREEEDAAVELEFAVENLTAESSQARDVAREQIADAGPVGLILVRKAFRNSSGMRLRLEATRIFRDKVDPNAAPLIVDALKTVPNEPLWSELLKALTIIIQRHSQSSLDIATLAELLAVAETMISPLRARMLRAIAANWEFGQLNRTQLSELFRRLQQDTTYEKRNLASLFCILYVKAANRDDQAFADLVGGQERLPWLQNYVGAAVKSEDEMIRTWAEQMGPMLALVDLVALKKGLLLYFDFNEPIYHPRYPGQKRPMIYCRDQSGEEVTPKTPRVILKGVLRENSRVPGADGNAIRFQPTGLIELPANWKFRQVMKTSYSYAAWIKPQGTPDGTSATPYWLIIGKRNGDVGLKYRTGNVAAFTHRTARRETVTATGTTTIQTGRWHHVAGVVDVNAGSVKLYVNGKLDAEGQFEAGTEGDPAMGTLFGAIGGVSTDESNPRTFDGVIDEVRIYDRAITADEAFDLYRAILPN